MELRREARRNLKAELTLDELKDGETGVIQAVRLLGPTKRRLIEMGITPGTSVYISKRAPLGDPIEVRLRGYRLTLRADDARRISVVREEVFE